jgi:hypothetical protein
MSTEILMPALSPTTSLVMARHPEPREARSEDKLHDRAIHPPVRTLLLRTCAARKSWIPAFAGMTKGGV